MPTPSLPTSFLEAAVPSIKISDGRESRTRKFTVDASDVDTLIEALFPLAFEAGTEIVRRSQTEYPSADHLLLTGATIEALDDECIRSLDSKGIAVGVKHMVTLDYSSKPKDELSIDVDTSAEFLRVAASGQMKWTTPLSENGSVLMSADAVAHRIIPTRTFNVKWRNVAKPNWTALSDLAGTVNDRTFAGCPAWTLLYFGSPAKEGVNAAGEVVYELGYKFVQRYIRFTGAAGLTKWAGWNHLYRPDVLDENTDDRWQVTDPLLYSESDFRDLFKAGTESLRDSLDAVILGR